MSNVWSGPGVEPWRSVHNKDGAHYNVYGCRDEDGMAALREFFPDGKADEMNVVLFSTSGVHGHYGTIEEVEPGREDPDEGFQDVTFLVIQPRIVCTRYGNCTPRNADDIAFLKKLRASSWAAVQGIGAPE